MRDIGNLFKIRNIVSWIANRLDVDCFCPLVDQVCKVVGTVTGDELGLDAESWQEDLELVIRAAVQI